ncbi:MAG: D-2-hydroxyacid dehydrogenase, partial [Chromatiales bacterium]|nr:D-2-hydroxyacid dehydrogenase [Chromatiales bacterium]
MAAPVLVIQGVKELDEVPGLAQHPGLGEVRLAPTGEALAEALPGADIMLGWNFAANDLAAAWERADSLKWIHWCGAGVDAALFPQLVNSRVTLTNARGIFDVPMAEYTLGLVLAFAKQLPQTFALQLQQTWRHRLTETIADKRVLVVGTGSIGCAIGRLLRSAGMQVDGVGRTARGGGDDFGVIHAVADLDSLLARADYVVLVTPLTEGTRGLFDAARFTKMKVGSRFINLGRGALIDEQALIDAVRSDNLSGAALDVFDTEPLPASSPLWGLPNVIVSPHMSGDFIGYARVLSDLFVDNLGRYNAGDELKNIVDKALG